jgi:hypothetical protein
MAQNNTDELAMFVRNPVPIPAAARKLGGLKTLYAVAGLLAFGGWALLMSALQVGAAPASVVLTNEALCGPSNAVAVLRRAMPQAAGTLRMIERLQKLRGSIDPATDQFMNEERAKLLETQLSQAANPRQQAVVGFQLAQQLLQAGQTEAALQQLQAAEEIFANNGLRLNHGLSVKLRMLKATAMLRLGEQENCLENHNADSCLFPLLPAAFHKLPRGSRGAVALLAEQLKESPEDLSARWLLNVAYMTLGEYPAQVPVEWLIPPKTFQSDYDLPRFPNVAGPLGVDVNGLAGGCILDDFDNDGLIDLASSSWALDAGLHYFHNDGDGHFTDRTAEAGLTGLMGGLNIQQTDYNNDGLLDIWIMRGGWRGKAGRIPASLLRNNGDGTFTDVTEEAGLLSAHPRQTAVWFDYPGDGWRDLFRAGETTDPNDSDPCELYHNNHDGTFTECAAACGLQVRSFIKGVTTLDYDNDGRPDLYLSSRDGENLLFHNDGPDASGQWKFTDTTRRAGLAASQTFPTWSFDYDNDGWEDIFVSGYAVQNVGEIAADYLGLPPAGGLAKLYHNNHDGTFTDATVAAHLNHVFLTMGCNFGDLDNDGWLDFYLGTGNPTLNMLVPNRMFRNAEGKLFQDVTTAGGFGHLQKGHAIGFADLDNDGNQDIYEVMGGAYGGDTAYSVLYHNPGSTNRWLKLKLTGVKSNRVAIGARIHVTVQTPGGPRQIYRTVNSGGSFGSNPLRQEIGLGNAAKIERVGVYWPASGIRQTLKDLELNHCYEVREGDSKARPIELKRIHFDLSARPKARTMKMDMPGMK